MRFVLHKKGWEKEHDIRCKVLRKYYKFRDCIHIKKIYIDDERFSTGYYFHEFIVLAQIMKINPSSK